MTKAACETPRAQSPSAHARLLKAQFIAPDETGNWTVAFCPEFELLETDFSCMADHIRSVPGLTIVECKTALTFTLDCSGKFDPETALTTVAGRLFVARRDHVIATQQLDLDGTAAVVRLLFRQKRTEGQLLDLSNLIALMDGVTEAEPTGENNITLELDAHYATEHGVELIVASIAHKAGAHVLRIETEDPLVPLKGARQMLDGLAAGVPTPTSASQPGSSLPAFMAPAQGAKRRKDRQERRKILLRSRQRGYRTFLNH